MNRRYPTIPESYQILESQGTLPNIVRHCELVMQTAMCIYNNLKNNDHLDGELIKISALLHDVTKTKSINTREAHAETGHDLLFKLGYPDVAKIILDHVFLSNFEENGPITESEIVHYSDKRVKHDRVVTLDERIDDLINRYGKTPERKAIIESNISFMKKLENKIFISLKNNIEKDLFELNEK